jgi:hypothetical protein
MSQPTIVNKFGTLLGWNSITVNILGRDLEGFTEVEYGDEAEVDLAYGRGGMPIGKTKGNYKPGTCSVTMKREEGIALQKQLPPGTRIQDIPDFDVVVSYEYGGQIYTDVMRNCSFKNNGVAVKQNDGSIDQKFDLQPSHISWNV